MTIPARLGATLCFVLTTAACGATTAPPRDAAADVAADAAECRRVAYDRVQNLPAVRSGQTTYIPGGPALYYQSCMKQRGYHTYPPY